MGPRTVCTRAQRTWITADCILDQSLQRRRQPRLVRHRTLASRTRTAHATANLVAPRSQLTDPSFDRAARQAGCLRQRGDTASSLSLRLVGREQPPPPFVEKRRRLLPAHPHGGKVDHRGRMDRPIRVAPSRIQDSIRAFSAASRFVNFAADPYLRDRWTAGERNVRCLLREVREQGFTGCYSRLAAFVAPWRQKVAMRPTPPAPVGTLPLDPRTGGLISPIVAAALCIKPRGLLTRRQAEKVAVLKQTLPMFACMRALAMRFRGLLRGNDPHVLDDWIRDAMGCGIYALQKFATKLRHDIDAVRNAICEPWSNGQTEGQINRLKMLKRAMYGRASVALLRARMRPLREVECHQM